MYAIIRAGGKQAKVQTGDVIEVERIKDADTEITFTPLLVVADDGSTISDRTVLKDAKVTAKILGDAAGPKLDIFKYKNKSGYRRRMGHRQIYTSIEVISIDLPGKSKSASKAKPKASSKTPSKATADKTKAEKTETASNEEE